MHYLRMADLKVVERGFGLERTNAIGAMLELVIRHSKTGNDVLTMRDLAVKLAADGTNGNIVHPVGVDRRADSLDRGPAIVGTANDNLAAGANTQIVAPIRVSAFLQIRGAEDDSCITVILAGNGHVHGKVLVGEVGVDGGLGAVRDHRLELAGARVPGAAVGRPTNHVAVLEVVLDAHDNGLDGAVFAKVEAVVGEAAVVAVHAAERVAVVDDVVDVGAGDGDDAVVARARGNGQVLLEDLVEALEGADRVVGDAVRDSVVGAAPAALAPEEIVLALALEHLGPLDVVFRRNLLVLVAVGESADADHVLVDEGDVGVAVAAVVDVGLAVVVDEDVLVNGLSAVVVLADERLANGVQIRALGAVCDANANATIFVICLNVVGAKVEVVFAIARDGSGGPDSSLRPREAGRIQDVGVLSPVDEVRR